MALALEMLAPGFIVAAPALRDPNFDHAVVLLCMHGDEGAMGLVVNRPARITLGEIMRQMDLECRVGGSQPAMVGGPVGLENGLLLYEVDGIAGHTEVDGHGGVDGSGASGLRVAEQLCLSPDQALLREIGNGQGPSRYHIFIGHAGWAPQQLEQEIAQGAWIPTRLDLELIFSTPIEDRWERALGAEGVHPAQVGSFRPVN